MQGGQELTHAPTRAFRLKNVFVIDGVLYKGKYSLHYRPRQQSIGLSSIDRTIESASMYCSTAGLKYFANWMSDDCTCYPLAVAEGPATTLVQPPGAHTAEYERLLGISPERVDNAFIKNVVVFEDFGQNAHKRRRAKEQRKKLVTAVPHDRHPGVFIMRGKTGARRVLVNEMEIADHLRLRRGFRIVDPVKLTVPEIIAACAGAEVVAGVEGSGLIHGAFVLRPGGSVLALQPPTRFVTMFKDLADQNGQSFGFVVGSHELGDDFRIVIDEVERTLDLLSAARAKAT